MLVFAGLIIGALTGAILAKRRGGRMVDMLQYATALAIAFALLGLFATIIITRVLL